MNRYSTLGVVCAFAWSAIASLANAAVPEIKPGLWEVTAKWDAPKPDLAKMTAEERERFEKGRPEREERIKQMQQPRPVCITGEMVSKGHWFGGGRRAADCEFSNVKTTSKTVTYEAACTGQRASVSKGKLTMISAEKFAGENVSKPAPSAEKSEAVTKGGPPRELKITTTGQWKAADCGATTPNYPKVK